MSMLVETLEVLRHVAVNGPRSRADICKAFPARPNMGHTVGNLAAQGYLAADATVTPICYTLTNKARQRLVAPGKPRAAHGEAAPAKARARRSSDIPRYAATEYSPSHRAGAMVAFALPSRMGNHLHYRDGRVTDMAGNPVE